VTPAINYAFISISEKPQCCAEYKYLNQMDALPDGNYTLYPGTPKTIPVKMYCKRDASVLTGYKEFVNLPYATKDTTLNRNKMPGDTGWKGLGGTMFSKVRISTKVRESLNSPHSECTAILNEEYPRPSFLINYPSPCSICCVMLS
jgi:hypothetical protein